MDENTSRTYPFREDMRFQRRSWRVERAGWTVLGLIALAALTGLFGNGYLSTVTRQAGDLTVRYERFARVTKLMPFDFHFATGGEQKLRLNGDFRRNFEPTTILPAPTRWEADGDGVALTFAFPANGGDVRIWAHPRAYLTSRLAARAGDGPPIDFTVFVYP